MGDARRRISALVAHIALLLAAVVGRLVTLQVLDAGSYLERGVAQRLRTVELPGERGAILDRGGAELALSVPATTVWADPRLVVDPAGVAAALAPILGTDPARLAERLATDGAFIYLARQVDDDVAAAVEDLELPGVATLEESERANPAAELARGLLGSVDLDGNGVSGLEGQRHAELLGEAGELLVERSPDGATIAGAEQRLTSAKRGDDLVLTIDRALQFEVERTLSDAVTVTAHSAAWRW